MIGLENPLHIALILIVVLMLFGAKRLPEMGRSLGEGLRGFKESIQGDDAAAREPARSAEAAVSLPLNAASAPVAAETPERAPLQPAA